ncbi:hypothetical protein IFR05_014096 [Cadophora sp. M221]|nr:hypothetical protein IFR05_014096 [Cadophora sp. M221]
MPLVHERSLRRSLALFSPDSEIFFPCHSPNSQGQSSTHPSSETDDLDLCRQFSLLTAVFAETCFVLPSHILPDGSRLANHFLKASRSCLNLQQDSDVESPISTSIIIRYFHSNSIHAMGKAKVSWFLLGEAIRLAQAMCLHQEYALENMDPVEAQLRRNIFWQLHTGDKSAALLNNRPFILHEFTLRDHISVRHAPPDGYSLLDTTRSHNSEPYESRLMQSFHLCQNLWSLGAKLLLDFQLLQPFCTSTSPNPPPLTELQTSTILDAYVQFLSFTDDMPAWLHEIEEPPDVTDANQVYQRAGFWIQRINLQVTFQSLSLIILQRFLDLNLLSLLGLSSEPMMIALKKTDIAREMLLAIQTAPFEFLQINGESCVEKIRRVGASLLEITQTIKNERIVKRAELELPNLLNILARLDSRASDLKQKYDATSLQ